MDDCRTAQSQVYQTPDGKWHEIFWTDSVQWGQEIPGPIHRTQTHPAKVLWDKGLCKIVEPAPVESQPVPLQAANVADISAPPGDASGAFLLVLGLIGAGAYAFWQQKNGRSDEELQADNYHPMADAPQLPPAFTDENLDVLSGRVSYPQYQGIQEPNPWAIPQAPTTPPPPTTTTPPPPTTSIPPVETTSGATGGGEVVEHQQTFTDIWLPAPKNGYFLGEESILSASSQARQIVRDAIVCGVSQNYLLIHVFKGSKNSKKHSLLLELIASVEKELGA